MVTHKKKKNKNKILNILIYKNIKDKKWEKHSPESFNFVKGMLNKNVQER